MDAWVRNLIMVVVMGVWAIYILVMLLIGKGEDIEVYWVGLPGAVYFALNPTFRKPGSDDRKSGES